MKVLIASTPATGHLNPLLAIGRALITGGHEVAVLCASHLRDRIEGIGAAFHAFPAGADLDTREIETVFPELKTMPPGPEMSLFYVKRVFNDQMPAQHQGLCDVLRGFPADIILADDWLYGLLPMLLGPRSERPPIALVGTMFLHYPRDDGAPNFAGLPPATNDDERMEYAAIFEQHEYAVYEPSRRHLNEHLANLSVKPVDVHPTVAMVSLPDAYLQLTVPSFEFPRRVLPPSVQFVGALPIVRGQAPLPPWAEDVDGSRRVVLVSQGTVSNHDLGQLVAPTLAALADEPDILVIVTTGGRSLDTIPGPIPSNARLASYLPFDWLLPKVDAFVTNGGYGSVNQALSFGIPIVAAGQTEDKADVSARVAWSGAGLNLATTTPEPQALRTAIRAVLDQPKYRSRAKTIAKDFANIDTLSEILGRLRQLATA